MGYSQQRAEAEQAIIGSLFVGECRRWREVTNHEAFAHPVYRRVWKAAAAMCERGILPTPTMAVNAAGYSDDDRKRLAPMAMITEACSACATDSNLDWWMTRLDNIITDERLAEVREQANFRLAAGDDSEAVLLWVKEQESVIKAGRDEGMRMAAMSGSVATVIDTALEGKAPEGLIYTGVKPLDYLSGGLLPGEYVVLAARPSCGKTSLALNAMISMASRGMRSCFFSLEMSREMIAASLTAIMCQISSRKLLREAHKLTYMEKQLLSERRQDIEAVSDLIHVYAQPGMKAAEMEKIARREVADGARLLAIDHVQLTTETAENESLRIGAFSKAWNRIIKENRVPGIALCQLNRDSVRENREPKPSDLKQSGSLEEDADVIWFIHPPRGIVTTNREKVKLLQSKGRTCGVGFAEAWLNGPTQTFSAVEEDIA